MLVSALFSLSRTVLSKRPIGLWTRYSKKRLSTLLRSARSAIVPYGTVAKMSGTGLILSVALGSGQLKTLKASSGKVRKPAHSEIIQQVDKLYEENKMKEALAYLEKHSDSTEAEVLWRLARLCYKVGKYHTCSHPEAQTLAEKAVVYAEKALKADANNFACHKWMGVIISWSSEFQGTKRKIERSFDIQEHFIKAIKLNPKDPTCRHLLGQWCYSVADVPWYQRKIASVVFATPPHATYEEALAHFQDAETIEPGFYSTNWLFIGKCFLQLGRVQEGGVWLKKAATYSSEVEEDLAAKREAETLLKKLGIN